MNELQIANLIANGSLSGAEVVLFKVVYYVRFYWSLIPDSFVGLLTDSGDMRSFNSLDTVASFLTDVGINRFEVITD